MILKTLSVAVAAILLSVTLAQAQAAAQPDSLSAFMGMASQVMNAQQQQPVTGAEQPAPNHGAAMFGAMMGVLGGIQQMQDAKRAQQQQAQQPAPAQ